jgi:hypothetical protein
LIDIFRFPIRKVRRSQYQFIVDAQQRKDDIIHSSLAFLFQLFEPVSGTSSYGYGCAIVTPFAIKFPWPTSFFKAIFYICHLESPLRINGKGGATNAPIPARTSLFFGDRRFFLLSMIASALKKVDFVSKTVPGESCKPLSVSKRHSTMRPTKFGLAPVGSRRFTISGLSQLMGNPNHCSCLAVSFLRPCHASRHTGLCQSTPLPAIAGGEGTFLSRAPRGALPSAARLLLAISCRALAYKNLAIALSSLRLL